MSTFSSWFELTYFQFTCFKTISLSLEYFRAYTFYSTIINRLFLLCFGAENACFLTTCTQNTKRARFLSDSRRTFEPPYRLGRSSMISLLLLTADILSKTSKRLSHASTLIHSWTSSSALSAAFKTRWLFQNTARAIFSMDSTFVLNTPTGRGSGSASALVQQTSTLNFAQNFHQNLRGHGCQESGTLPGPLSGWDYWRKIFTSLLSAQLHSSQSRPQSRRDFLRDTQHTTGSRTRTHTRKRTESKYTQQCNKNNGKHRGSGLGSPINHGWKHRGTLPPSTPNDSSNIYGYLRGLQTKNTFTSHKLHQDPNDRHRTRPHSASPYLILISVRSVQIVELPGPYCTQS